MQDLNQKRIRIQARFKPRFPEKWDSKTIESCMKNKVFYFKYAYTLNDGDTYWEPDDLGFPNSKPVNEKDLEIINLNS